MTEQKRTCGQCELYLNKKEKCPHQEKTAFSEGCEIFVYTNPEVRIDGLQAENKELKLELKASDNWLHRLLKSCVIFLDDGEVTKRAVEKQSRYNQHALKGE